MFSKADDDDDDDDDEQQQTSKKIIKNNVTFNEWINKEETDINKNYLKNILISKDLVICSNIYTKQMIETKIIN